MTFLRMKISRCLFRTNVNFSLNWGALSKNLLLKSRGIEHGMIGGSPTNASGYYTQVFGVSHTQARGIEHKWSGYQTRPDS